jgi:hypothetical protein
MLMQIISHTPTWVFILFAALLALGTSQFKTRTASLKRITIMPVAMLGLALSGVVSAFGKTNGSAAVLSWAMGAVVMGLCLFSRPAPQGTRYEAASKLFSLPGSMVPMVLILGIFFTKYVVGASLGFHPELAQNTGFALGVSGLYGVFSGIFAARAAQLWRLAGQQIHWVAGVAQRDPW